MTTTMCGSVFDPAASLLAGVDDATVRLWLSKAQTALMELSTGNKIASASYSQGDGSQSVTYTQADMARLQAFITLCQSQLGIARRRPVRFAWR